MTEKILEEYSKYDDSMLLGRVTSVHKSQYLVNCNKVQYKVKISGRFEYMAFEKSDYPIVGDYVIFKPSEYDDTGIIEKVCTRYSQVQRIDAGRIQEKHILAANIDIIFVCLSLNQDFNLKKLQNFMSVTYGSNAEAIVLLTKKDLCENIEEYVSKVHEVNRDYQVMVISSFNKDDISMLEETIGKKTAVFIGSSGVGKSTLINTIIGYDHLKTLDIRTSDAQGKHATTHREMVELPSGGFIIDTPGIRVVESYIVEDVEDSFDEISELSKECMYNDCTHQHEPNCKVIEALNNGELSGELFESYKKVLKLNEHIKRRELERERIKNKRSRR